MPLLVSSNLQQFLHTVTVIMTFIIENKIFEVFFFSTKHKDFTTKNKIDDNVKIVLPLKITILKIRIFSVYALLIPIHSYSLQKRKKNILV